MERQRDPTYHIRRQIGKHDARHHTDRTRGIHSIAVDGVFRGVGADEASRAPTAMVDDSYMKQKIHILDANSFKLLGTIEHAAKLGTYVWSPDSKQIAMIAGADIHDPARTDDVP